MTPTDRATSPEARALRAAMSHAEAQLVATVVTMYSAPPATFDAPAIWSMVHFDVALTLARWIACGDAPAAFRMAPRLAEAAAEAWQVYSRELDRLRAENA